MRHIKYAILLLIFVLFAGCGNKNDGGHLEYKFHDKYNDKSELKFGRFENLTIEDVISKNDCERVVFLSSPKVYAGKTYGLYSIMPLNVFQALRWVLVSYDVETCKFDVKEISRECLGLSNDTDGFLIDVTIVDDEHYIFQYADFDAIGNLSAQTVDKRIYTDLNGNNTYIELQDVLQKNGYSPLREYTDGIYIPEANCICDSAGNLYGICKKSDVMYLWAINKEGKISFEYRLPKEWEIDNFIEADTGQMFCLLYDGKDNKQYLTHIDLQAKCMDEMAAISSEFFIKKIYDICGDIVCYEEMGSGKVFLWDTKSGNRDLLLDYRCNCLPNGYEPLLVRGLSGAMFLRVLKGDYEISDDYADWITRLTSETDSNRISIACFVNNCSGNKRIARAASLASAGNLNCNYEIKEIFTKEERDYVISELIAGKGPDILYLSRGDFETYAERGILYDFSELLSQDMFDKVLPGALEMGRASKEIFGLPVCVKATSIMLSNDVWEKEAWTFDEMNELIQKHLIEGQLYYSDADMYFYPQATALWILKESLLEKPLVDLKNKTCNIKEPAIINYLTLLKNATTTKESSTMFAGGKRAVFDEISSTTGITLFGLVGEYENAHYVGFPTSETTGNYLEADGIIAVNKRTHNTEGVTEYLNKLFDRQYDYGEIPFSDLDIYKIQIPEYEHGEDGKIYVDGQEIRILDNGKTTIESAKEFLEGCVAAPIHYEEIENILVEELEAYFESEKSAEDVLDVIQKRIQIFLNEL